MLYSILNLAAFSPAIYWLTERNLPLLIALLFTDEADLKLEQQLKGLAAADKPSSLEDFSSITPSKDSTVLGNPQSSVQDENKPPLEPRTRSFKVPINNRNKLPDPAYQKGDFVWLTVDGEEGSFKVNIVTDGMWSRAYQVWQYQVRQTDGELYDNGNLVGEADLHRAKK